MRPTFCRWSFVKSFLSDSISLSIEAHRSIISPCSMTGGTGSKQPRMSLWLMLAWELHSWRSTELLWSDWKAEQPNRKMRI